MQWYKGDGVYGDGENFHWDYYNSYVIQPMLLEILHTPGNEKALYAEVLKRAQRYAAIQERLISPEGTYPAVGRSLAYRFGAKAQAYWTQIRERAGVNTDYII